MKTVGTPSLHEKTNGIGWLVNFLNLDLDHPNRRQQKSINELLSNTKSDLSEASKVQRQWKRSLLFFVGGAKVTEVIDTGITVLDGMIKTQEEALSRIPEETKEVFEGADDIRESPEPGSKPITPEEWSKRDEQTLRDELDALKDEKRKLSEFSFLSESEAQARFGEIRKVLKGARFLTREEALKALCVKLTTWGMTVKLIWRYRTAAEAAKGYIKPGQAHLQLNGKKFVVDHFPGNHRLDDMVHHIVAQGLENGELARLRRCGECSRFFFAQHASKGYCTSEHQRQHDKKEARKRAKRWRTMMAEG